MKENFQLLLTLAMDLKLLCRLRELILRELGFHDIFKKVKVNCNKVFLPGIILLFIVVIISGRNCFCSFDYFDSLRVGRGER